MEQKTTWMRYLLIGISISTFLFTNCIRKVDYQVRAKWIYINETGHNITYRPDSWSTFNVKAFDTTIYYQDGDDGKNVSEADFISPINAQVLFYDDIKCDTLERGNKAYMGNGPIGMDNYESKKISNNNFEFTYRFTEKQYLDAKECK